MVTDQSVKEELFALCEEDLGDDFVQAILSFGGELGKDERGYYLFYSTHDYRLALAFSSYLKRAYSYDGEIGITAPEDKRRKRYFTVSVRSRTALSLLADLKKIRVSGGAITLLDSGLKSNIAYVSDPAAYVRGVFLSCGSLSRASGAMRLTFVFDLEEYADEFRAFLEGEEIVLSKSERDGKFCLTSRRAQAISDFFALAGANKTVLAVQDKLVLTEVKTKIQRASNLSAANMDKAMSAAVKQYNDALYLKEHTSFYGVPEELASVAKARLEYKDASLEELREKLPEKISKSGLYHRFEKIGEMVNALREEEDESNG